MKTNNYTVSDAAKAFNVNRNTIERAIRSGQLNATKQGKSYVITAAAFAEYRQATCEHCTVVFTLSTARQRYCTDKCRFAAAYEARKQSTDKQGVKTVNIDEAVDPSTTPKRLQATFKHINRTT